MALRWIVLLLGLGLTAAEQTGERETDVDEGHDWDILNINKAAGTDLLEGDIIQDEIQSRNSILLDNLWPTTIPYYLNNTLDMNAKGVVLKAFDQFRLKTCIDFRPWKGEKHYIHVYKGRGCSSYVGNQKMEQQWLSIGNNCDHLGIVEHEFLHALGFWHEHSRVDRDDYIDIIWGHIEPGKKHNFVVRETSALGVPYDYDSVMHYSNTSFNILWFPTIVTKLPQFTDVIGQRMGFSANDVTKLNLLYKCTKSLTFVDSCSFEEENICGMIQNSSNPTQWERHSSVTGGPESDFTNMGQCKGKGFFMHFSTASAQTGEHALLESRWFYLKPGAQCLQFFLYNTGSADDVLNIWVREYDSISSSGELKFFKSISGGVMNSWQLHTVNLNVKKKAQKARVVFEAVRGNGASKGGLSLDDINLSTTQCPQHIWQIRNITNLMATTPVGTILYSPRFLSPTGYSFQVGVYLNGRNRPGSLATYFYLTSGPNDHRLKWPCRWHQATMALMDQQSDIRQHMNMHLMVTTDPNKMFSNGIKYWDDPKKVGFKVTESDGSYYYRGPGYGTKTFITHGRLKSRNFIKGDNAFFLLSLEGVESFRH
ncbi:meprin A subunit beta-like [Acanthochromis polyacanthus]|uniref:meprin A subunit beta-like n=1 Tax=Acanthochromis polyacanthus TaxID=80966 RepID=UPI0022347DA9|nr:meprin A subunit beta-like [Acanthochromis polyacanthus]